MAKLSSINKNNRRRKLSDRFYAKRKKLKLIIMNKKLPLEDIAASFENVVAEVLVERSLRCALDQGLNSLVLVGGVAANEFLRDSLADAMPSNVKLHFPDFRHCTDNGLMVAHAGLMKIENSEKNYNIEARARWSLEENNDAR